MAVQSLWQRTSRTLLALSAIGITVGGIMALEAIVRGAMDMIGTMGGDAEIMIRQAGIADTGYSTIDERVGDKITLLPEVQSASGLIFTATALPDAGMFFILQGYAPHSYSIQRFNVTEGEYLSGNHQMMLGRMIADAMHKEVGDTIEIGNTRFKIVGIFESGSGWQEMGGVISLRDAQTFAGKPRKVSLYMVKLNDTTQAAAVVEEINTLYPEIHAALTGEFADQMPDMQSMDAMMGAISFLAIFVGGVGVMNTMLMAVFERERELGMMRAMGMKDSQVKTAFFIEAAGIGLIGSVFGIILGFGLDFWLVNYGIDFSFFMREMDVGYRISGMFYGAWNFGTMIKALIIGVLMTVVVAYFPIKRGLKLEITECLRDK